MMGSYPTLAILPARLSDTPEARTRLAHALPCGCVVEVTDCAGWHWRRFRLRWLDDACPAAAPMGQAARLEHWQRQLTLQEEAGS